MHDDFTEAGALRLELLPKPRRHIFNGRILETFDVVEVRMIEPLHERLHGGTNLSVIVNPTGLWIDLAFDRDLQFKTVPMHPTAFVSFRGTGQSLGRFEGEILGESRSHGAENSTDPAELSLRVGDVRSQVGAPQLVILTFV